MTNNALLCAFATALRRANLTLGSGSQAQKGNEDGLYHHEKNRLSDCDTLQAGGCRGSAPLLIARHRLAALPQPAGAAVDKIG